MNKKFKISRYQNFKVTKSEPAKETLAREQMSDLAQFLRKPQAPKHD